MPSLSLSRARRAGLPRPAPFVSMIGPPVAPPPTNLASFRYRSYLGHRILGPQRSFTLGSRLTLHPRSSAPNEDQRRFWNANLAVIRSSDVRSPPLTSLRVIGVPLPANMLRIAKQCRGLERVTRRHFE